MSDHGRGLAVLPTSPHLAVEAAQPKADAVTLLTCYVVLLMAIPSTLVVGSFGAAGAPAALFAAVAFCWYLVARQHPGLGMDRGRQPVRAAAIGFGCTIVAAYVSANRIAMPTARENAADRGLLLLAGWVGVLLLAADGIDRADRLRTLVRRMVTGATAMATLAIAEFFTGVVFTKYVAIPGLIVHEQLTDLSSREGFVRVIATAGQPLELASVLAMCLPLAIHQARFATPAVRFRRWAQVALIAAAIPMTVSRSAILGLAVICVVLIPTWTKRDRRRAYLVLLGTPIMVWLAKPSVLTGFAQLFGQLGTDASSASRTDAYTAAVPLIAQHLWLGQGFQTFFPQTYFFVDDQYLTSLIETGVLGLIALIALFVTGWWTARKARLTAPDAQTRDLAQCLAASVAAGAVSFATFDAMSFTIAPGVCFLVIGCTGALWRLARAERKGAVRLAA
jgi:O-antigen ligase